MNHTKSVKHMVKHPATGKRLQRVFVTGKGWFGWNTTYHVYNSVENYEQLKNEDVAKIDFGASEK